MRFIVETVRQDAARTFVTGRTDAGPLQGVWCGKETPVSGGAYHAELTVNACVRQEAPTAKRPRPGVRLDGDRAVFLGVCEEVQDGISFVRFDADWLEMVDSSIFPDAEKGPGSFCCFAAKAQDILIYPYTL